MSLIVPLFVNLALIVAAFKLSRWYKRRQGAERTRWRRRMGLLLFCAPLLVWIGELILPAAFVVPLELFDQIGKGIDAGIAKLTSATRKEIEEASGMGLMALKPLLKAVAYTTVGFIIGWPLDLLAKRKKGEAKDGEAEAAKEPE